jgi:hypothetical protein
LIINVTQTHLTNGISISPVDCPIALALKDAGFKKPVVGSYGIYRNLREYFNLQYYLPVCIFHFSIKNIISNIDRRKTVEPFSFEVPDDLIESFRD